MPKKKSTKKSKKKNQTQYIQMLEMEEDKFSRQRTFYLITEDGTISVSAEDNGFGLVDISVERNDGTSWEGIRHSFEFPTRD